MHVSEIKMLHILVMLCFTIKLKNNTCTYIPVFIIYNAYLMLVQVIYMDQCMY